jgi:hypothetical protein
MGEVRSGAFPILIEGDEPSVSVALIEECVDPSGSKREPSQLSVVGCAEADEVIARGKSATIKSDFFSIPETPVS